MVKHRISIDLEEDEHKYLKMCCAKLGVTLKDFTSKAVIERVDAWEDEWMLARWARDGTNEELERERNDPNREVFQLVRDDSGEFDFKPVIYSDFIGKVSRMSRDSL